MKSLAAGGTNCQDSGVAISQAKKCILVGLSAYKSICTHPEDSFDQGTFVVGSEDIWSWIHSLFIVNFEFQDYWNFETHPPSHVSLMMLVLMLY